MRSLSPEEDELWAKVAATIKPLSRDTPQPQASEKTSRSVEPAKIARASARQARPAAPPPRRGIGTTLDGGWDRRLREGSIDPDRTVDLHGLNLDNAWRTIDSSLERAIDRAIRRSNAGGSARRCTTGSPIHATPPGLPPSGKRIGGMEEAAASM